MNSILYRSVYVHKLPLMVKRIIIFICYNDSRQV
ncbi:unnamed protein product [Acanthoscelides obtectus]|uniref:Uncharacterized protein n=1 Tax=Acanthoscelides obtectus TaxID=200917 RepID=A0A9P0PJK9_ACAOB|nr:unnamed protein product [Acanthoscelides obtectus]CAK1638353.1 hypothetical protein AOBTE_LOCUS10556 [Acanthoscelides obtectus]